MQIYNNIRNSSLLRNKRLLPAYSELFVPVSLARYYYRRLPVASGYLSISRYTTIGDYSSFFHEIYNDRRLLYLVKRDIQRSTITLWSWSRYTTIDDYSSFLVEIYNDRRLLYGLGRDIQRSTITLASSVRYNYRRLSVASYYSSVSGDTTVDDCQSIRIK